MMKILRKTIALLLMISTAFISCKKDKPVVAATEISMTETPANNKVLGPIIIPNSSAVVTLKGSSKLNTVFSPLTASFYGAGLYAHTATSSSGPWSVGSLPNSFVSPNAVYNLPLTYLIGSTVYIFYSTSPGIAYPAGSSSNVYSTVVI
jgi:hypothetical protein